MFSRIISFVVHQYDFILYDFSVIPYNLDGREFIQKLVRDGIVFDHVIMNLPASAVTFLDVFRGISSSILSSTGLCVMYWS